MLNLNKKRDKYKEFQNRCNYINIRFIIKKFFYTKFSTARCRLFIFKVIIRTVR